MSIRSVIMTLVLIALVALLVIGRLRSHARPRGVHVRTSALVHRMEKSARRFDRFERAELARLIRAGHSAPGSRGAGVSPRA